MTNWSYTFSRKVKEVLIQIHALKWKIFKNATFPDFFITYNIFRLREDTPPGFCLAVPKPHIIILGIIKNSFQSTETEGVTIAKLSLRNAWPKLSGFRKNRLFLAQIVVISDFFSSNSKPVPIITLESGGLQNLMKQHESKKTHFIQFNFSTTKTALYCS